MLAIDLSLDVFTNIKDTIRETVPEAGSVRRVEAAARGLGFSTYAGLRAAVADGTPRVAVDGTAFAAFLPGAGPETGKAFVEACAVQAMLAAMRRHPELPVGSPVAEEIRTGDAKDWGNHRARYVAREFLAVLACLGEPVFLSRLGRHSGADKIAEHVRKRTGNRVRWPIAMQAALHAGLPLMEWEAESLIPVFLVLGPNPRTGVAYPEWIAPTLAACETIKDRARAKLERSVAAGVFDDHAAEALVKALWCRAFGLRLEVAGIPDWREYGRMLLADPELCAFGLSSQPERVGAARARIESLCGGGAIPGLKVGYTYVFEGSLKDLMESPRRRVGTMASRRAEAPADEAPPPRP